MECQKSNRVTECVDLILKRMGVMLMKKGKRKKHNKRIKISLMGLLTFGIFLLALLTFVFTFCK